MGVLDFLTGRDIDRRYDRMLALTRDIRAGTKADEENIARLTRERAELLVALERIRDHYDDTDLAAKHMAAIARAAITRATGEQP